MLKFVVTPRFLSGALVISLITLSACSQTPHTGVANPVEIMKRDGRVQLAKGPLSVTVTPETGGRIASLQYKGQELLITPARTDNLLWGNVLWTGPQKDWGWPPLETLDSKPYDLEQVNNRLILTSAIDPKSGYRFVKTYQFDPLSYDLLIDYSIYNHSDDTRHIAPWEVTRVPAKGVVFFPTGETQAVNGGMNSLPVEQRGNLTWFEYDPSRLEGDHKMMTDGAGGWLAHATGDYLFVKQFLDVPAASNVEGEGEIHIYTDPGKTYIEMEQQGPLSILEPGESLHWRVRWRVLPPSAAARLQSESTR